jgi:hypothetical protein
MAKIVLKTGEVLEMDIDEALEFAEKNPDLIQPQTITRMGPRRREIIKGS